MWEKLSGNGLELAAELSAWKEKMHRLWHQVRIEEVEAEGEGEVTVGTMIPLRAKIRTGEIALTEIAVEAYIGVLDSLGAIVGGELVSIATAGEYGPGAYHFGGEIECRFCGRHGFLLRVMPKHRELGPVYEPGLLLWG